MDPSGAIASGCSSIVSRRADGRCVHVPRSAAAATSLRYAARIPHVLAPYVEGFELPLGEACLSPTDEWLYGASVSRWIDGAHVSAATNPRSVARFLGMLHAIDPSDVSPPVKDFDAWIIRQFDRGRTGLYCIRDLIDPRVSSYAAKALADLQHDLAQLADRSIVHGDFWNENLVQRDGELVGVLDWEECAVGDPAIDLAGLWYLGDSWAQEVISRLAPSDDEINRCAAWRVMRELDGAAWSHEHGDETERHQSAGKLTSVVSRFAELKLSV